MHNEITEGAQLSGDRRCARAVAGRLLSLPRAALSPQLSFFLISLPQQVRLLWLAFGDAFSAFPGPRLLPFEIGLVK